MKNIKKRNNVRQDLLTVIILLIISLVFVNTVWAYADKNRAIQTENEKLGVYVEQLEEKNERLLKHNKELLDNVKNQDITKAENLISNIEIVDSKALTKSKLVNYINELQNGINLLIENGYDSNSNTQYIYENLVAEFEEANYNLTNELYLYPYSEQEYNLLAKVVMREQGDNRSDDEAQMLVACVVLNRVNNNGINGNLTNPTILDILCEPGQYGKGYSWNIDTSNITDKVWENTRKVLEHEYEAPVNVLFQATFKQGSGVYKSFYNEGYNNYTYFCYI